MGETMKSERPRKRWREEIEENLNIMGIKKKSGNVQRRRWDLRKILL
jgi:hypothetical protein